MRVWKRGQGQAHFSGPIRKKDPILNCVVVLNLNLKICRVGKSSLRKLVSSEEMFPKRMKFSIKADVARFFVESGQGHVEANHIC